MVETTTRAPSPDTATRSTSKGEARGFSVRWRNPEHGLVDYVGAIWARRKGLLITTALCGVVGLFYALRKPDTFASQATLMVHGSSSVVSSGDVAANLIGTGTILPTQVLTAVEVIHSSVVLRRVVERVGFEEILRPYRPTPRAGLANLGFIDSLIDRVHHLQARWFGAETPDYSRYDQEALIGAAVRTLERNLVVVPATRGTTVALAYQHSTPAGAEKILRAISEESIRRFSSVVAPPEGKDWLDTKLAEADEEEERARASLDAFAEKHGTTDLTAEILTMGTAVATMDGNLRLAKTKLRENESVLDSLREQIATPSARASGANYASLQKAIQTREIELIGLRTQIPLLEESLGESKAALEAKRSLQREVDRLNTAVTETAAQNKRLRDLAKTYEINNELETRGLTHLRLVEPAEVPQTKAGPLRSRIVIGATLGAFLLSVSLVLLRVRLSRKLVHHQDVTFALGRSDVVSTPLLNEGNLQRFDEARRRGWE